MTDQRPYEKHTKYAVLFALGHEEPPADITQITAPRFIVSTLERCWNVDPASRPTMRWCIEVLSWGTTCLFAVYYFAHLTAIPFDYVASTYRYYAIYNPDSKKRFNLEFLPDFVGGDGRYVPPVIRLDPNYHC